MLTYVIYVNIHKFCHLADCAWCACMHKHVHIGGVDKITINLEIINLESMKQPGMQVMTNVDNRDLGTNQINLLRKSEWDIDEPDKFSARDINRPRWEREESQRERES